jgi:Ala-tRNA(Pro) deacylase
MVPSNITRHLEAGGIPVRLRPHRREVTAQRLAAAVHVTGHRVAKSIVVDVDGARNLAVLPAADIIDTQRLAEQLGAEVVRIMNEREFAELFADCEVGAEPPFGSLYGLPVIVDRSLLRSGGPLVFRAGSHEDALEMSCEEFLHLERPRLADFSVPAPSFPRFDEERLGI